MRLPAISSPARTRRRSLLEKHWQAAPAVLTEAFNQLAGNPAVSGGVAGLGFSFGGFQLLGLQETLPLRRVVTYYADREVKLKVPVLGHFAETDPFADDQEGMIRALNRRRPAERGACLSGHEALVRGKGPAGVRSAAAEAAFERSVAFLRG